MTETLVIYHGGCRDGFCAAWVVNKYLRQEQDKEIVRLGQSGGPTFDLGRGPVYHPGFYGHEVLHQLCLNYPKSEFSMYWFKRADGMYQYGMRSIGDFDVSTVAKLFGGGGHKNAAGFQLKYLLEELK